MSRGRARKGDRIECPTCHRWIGYWPDKTNPYLAHLMPHRSHEGLYGHGVGPYCAHREVNG